MADCISLRRMRALRFAWERKINIYPSTDAIFMADANDNRIKTIFVALQTT